MHCTRYINTTKSILVIIVHHYLITTTSDHRSYHHVYPLRHIIITRTIDHRKRKRILWSLLTYTGPPYEDTYLVNRLWSIQSSSWSDLDVIEEFNKGFAPIVTNMKGFIQYTAAQNNYNSSTVYFSNVFESQELAHEAQLAAQEFVADGALKDVIVPYYFTESKIAFDIATDECVDTSHSGMYLNTRLYKVISINGELCADRK